MRYLSQDTNIVLKLTVTFFYQVQQWFGHKNPNASAVIVLKNLVLLMLLIIFYLNSSVFVISAGQIYATFCL